MNIVSGIIIVKYELSPGENQKLNVLYPISSIDFSIPSNLLLHFSEFLRITQEREQQRRFLKRQYFIYSFEQCGYSMIISFLYHEIRN